MDFHPDDLAELRRALNAVNVRDDMIARGETLTKAGVQKVASAFGIQEHDVPAMLQACADMVADDLQEDSERFTYEGDYMGNLTLRDSETGKDIYLQGDEAFALTNKLEQNPDHAQVLIGQYFDQQPLNEFVAPQDEYSHDGGPLDWKNKNWDDDVLDKVDGERKHAEANAMANGGSFNFPYKGKFATARFWISPRFGPRVKVISLIDAEDNETVITPDLQTKLDAIALTWVDKV